MYASWTLAALLASCWLSLALADTPPPLPLTGQLACSPLGDCEACPANQRSEPACSVYGNRRLIRCFVVDSLEQLQGLDSSSSSSSIANNPPDSKVFTSYEPCPRAIETERKDFWEFILANFSFAIVALFVVVIRGRIIAARHYNQLVSKIGFPFQLLAGGSLSSSSASTGGPAQGSANETV